MRVYAYHTHTCVATVMNSRPITPVSSSPLDFAALTPGHFLIGRPLTSLPLSSAQLTVQPLLQHWQHLNKVMDEFWQRWRNEYLQILQTFNKWHVKHENIQIGTLVLVKDDNLPPLCWNLARVTKVHPGTDGVVRVVTLKTEFRDNIVRPVSKICPILAAKN